MLLFSQNRVAKIETFFILSKRYLFFYLKAFAFFPYLDYFCELKASKANDYKSFN